MTFSLERFPKLQLGHFPTPLERLDRLSGHLGGPEIWIKRDDCTGLAFGGNKTRKLEYLLGDARRLNAGAVITFGALQSNHARQTIAACAKTGFECHAILTDVVPYKDDAYRRSGNLLLDRLSSATLHIVQSVEEAAERLGVVQRDLAERNTTPYIIPPGGSTAVGALGYVEAGIEIDRQSKADDLHFNRIICASSTAGTQAGLTVAMDHLSPQTEVLGVNVFEHKVEVLAEKLEKNIEDLSKILSIEKTTRRNILDGFLGGGYGLPTDGMKEAVRTLMSLEGILLDPVYSGKAMSALFSLCRKKTLTKKDRVLFVHTGGAPGLFAYNEVFNERPNTPS